MLRESTPKDKNFQIPTAAKIAELISIATEVNELMFNRWKPIVMAGAGIFSDQFVLNMQSNNPANPLAIILQQIVLSLYHVVHGNPQQHVELSRNCHYTSQQGWQCNQQMNMSDPYQDLQSFADSVLPAVILSIQFPLMGILYYLGKKAAKGLIHKFSLSDILPDDNDLKQHRLSSQEVDEAIARLKPIRDELRKSSYRLTKWMLFVALLAYMFQAVAEIDTWQDMYSRFLTYLILFIPYLLIQNFWNNRQLNKSASTIDDFHKQLNEFTQPLHLKWTMFKGGYLKSSFFTLNFNVEADTIKINHEKIPKELVFGVLKETLRKYGVVIVCQNPDKGLIVSRDKVFSAKELKSIKDNFKDELDSLAEKQQAIKQLIKQLNDVKKLWRIYQDWEYYPSENFVAINLKFTSQTNIDELKAAITEIAGEARVEFKEDSHYLIVKVIQPLNDQRLQALKKKLLETPKPKEEAEEAVESEQQGPSKPKVKTRGTSSADGHEVDEKEREIETKNLNGYTLIPLYHPSYSGNNHFSIFTEKNQGIMTNRIKASNKAPSYFNKCKEILETGRMNGRGHHIARLKRPKKITGVNGHTIFATHKIKISGNVDMRVFGHMDKVEVNGKQINVIDFDTVVPKHKWSSR